MLSKVLDDLWISRDPNCMNFFMIFELIRIAGPTFMSQSSNLALGFGVFFGWLIFGELPSHWVWGAITLILIGVALVNTRHKEP